MECDQEEYISSLIGDMIQRSSWSANQLLNQVEDLKVWKRKSMKAHILFLAS